MVDSRDIILTPCPEVMLEEIKVVSTVYQKDLEHTAKFPVTIAWIRQTEAEVVLLHGRQRVKNCAKFCDAFSLGSAFTGGGSAVGRAMDIAEYYEVTTESSLEVAVIATCSDRPMTRLEGQDRDNRRAYLSVPGNWRVEVSPGVPEELPLRPREFLEAKVWSSKATPEENATTVKNMLQAIQPHQETKS